MEKATETTKMLLNEKRKWQIALRRYVLEGIKSYKYAPYFGIDTINFKKWIEIQFDNELHWENFSKAWQLEHVIPVAYFDFYSESDLKLCWNFINIKVEKTGNNKKPISIMDFFTKKNYFEKLYDKTGYTLCKQMIEKIDKIEQKTPTDYNRQVAFIQEKKDYLNVIADFTSYDFDRLNSGDDLATILKEKAFLKKFE